MCELGEGKMVTDYAEVDQGISDQVREDTRDHRCCREVNEIQLR